MHGIFGGVAEVVRNSALRQNTCCQVWKCFTSKWRINVSDKHLSTHSISGVQQCCAANSLFFFLGFDPLLSFALRADIISIFFLCLFCRMRSKSTKWKVDTTDIFRHDWLNMRSSKAVNAASLRAQNYRSLANSFTVSVTSKRSRAPDERRATAAISPVSHEYEWTRRQ